MAFLITDDCVACGNCLVVCPENAINDRNSRDIGRGDTSAVASRFYRITNGCTGCGSCAEVCPSRAVIQEP